MDADEHGENKQPCRAKEAKKNEGRTTDIISFAAVAFFARHIF
jgi:hypothetical protein